MTARATPKVIRWGEASGRLDPTAVVPQANDGGVWIACEAFGPQSMAGRTVNVFFPASVIDDVLRVFRDQARDNRNRSGPQDDIPSPLVHKPDPVDALARLVAQARDLADEP